MKRSLNSSDLDIAFVAVDADSFQPVAPEACRETQGTRLMNWASGAPLAAGGVQADVVSEGRRRRSSGRQRQGRRSDAWESYVLENWVPTLERTLGADWQQHCPGEVAALMWWAVATRAGLPGELQDARRLPGAGLPTTGKPRSGGSYGDAGDSLAHQAPAAPVSPSRSPVMGSCGAAVPQHTQPQSASSSAGQPPSVINVAADTLPRADSAGGCDSSSSAAPRRQHRVVLLSPTAANAHVDTDSGLVSSGPSGSHVDPALTLIAAIVASPFPGQSTAQTAAAPAKASCEAQALPAVAHTSGGPMDVRGGDGLVLLAIPSNGGKVRLGQAGPSRNGGPQADASTSAAAAAACGEAAVGAQPATDGHQGRGTADGGAGEDLFRMLQKGLEARLAVTAGMHASAGTGSSGHGASRRGAAASAAAASFPGPAVPGSASSSGSCGSGRTLPVLDLSRPPPASSENASGGNAAAPDFVPSAADGETSGADRAVAASGSASGGSESRSTYVLDLHSSGLADALGGVSLGTLLNAVSAEGDGTPRTAAAALHGDHGSAVEAALGPRGEAGTSSSALPASAAATPPPATAPRVYDVQLPDGTVLPVQFLPLRIPLGDSDDGGDTAAEAAAAASALGLDDDLCSLLLGGTGGSRGLLAEALNKSDRRGRLPLHAAAATGRAEVVERLLALGCDAGARLEQDFLRSAGAARAARHGPQHKRSGDSDATSSDSFPSGPAADAGAEPGVSSSHLKGGSSGSLGDEGKGAAGAVAEQACGGLRRESDDSTCSGVSEDSAFGGGGGSSPLSVAQAARLGLQFALDTCGDRLTAEQLQFLAGKFVEQQLWKGGPVSSSALPPGHLNAGYAGSLSAHPIEFEPGLGSEPSAEAYHSDASSAAQPQPGVASPGIRQHQSARSGSEPGPSPQARYSETGSSDGWDYCLPLRRDGSLPDAPALPGAAPAPGPGRKRRPRRLGPAAPRAVAEVPDVSKQEALVQLSRRSAGGGGVGGGSGQKRPADSDAIDGELADDELPSPSAVSHSSRSADGVAGTPSEGAGQQATAPAPKPASAWHDQQPGAGSSAVAVDADAACSWGNGADAYRPSAGSDEYCDSLSDDLSDDESDGGSGAALQGAEWLDGLSFPPPPLPLPPQLGLPPGLALDRLRPRRRRRWDLPSFARRPSYIGATPLHLAAAHGHVEVVEQLLRAPGCDPAATTSEGRTALHLAARNGHHGVVALMLRVMASPQGGAGAPASGGPAGGGPVNAADGEGLTALHLAAALGHWRVVEELWPRGASVDPVDASGRTPLHYAALGGYVETVGRLVIGGAAVHRADRDGYTPAHLAAMRGHAEVLEKLLLAGYEVDRRGGPVARDFNRDISASAKQPRSQQEQTQRGLPLPMQQRGGDCAPSTSVTGGSVAAAGSGSLTALHLAAAGGHCAAVAVLLQAGAGGNVRDSHGRTALQAAAEGGHRGAFELLLMHGSDPRVTDCAGASALHSAARGGNLAIVARLLELADAEPEPEASPGAAEEVRCDGRQDQGDGLEGQEGKEDGSVTRPWELQGQHGERQMYERERDRERKRQRERDCGTKGEQDSAVEPDNGSEQQVLANGSPSGGTRKHVASSADSGPQATARHVDAGSSSAVGSRAGRRRRLDPAAATVDGQLPLHWAALAGRVEVVSRLLQLGPARGGNALALDANGATPWHLAAAMGREAVLRVLLASQGPEHEGAAAAEPQKAAAAAVRVDARDGSGCTALHRAAAGGAVAAVALLLSSGADPAAVCSSGRTPLHYAAEAGLLGLVRLLLHRLPPGEVDRRDAAGWSALHHAARRGDGCMLRLLLAAGADPHSATQRGWTAAHLAARGQHDRSADLLEVLLAAGADPQVADADGATPLHFAALRGDQALFQRLLEAAQAAEAQGAPLSLTQEFKAAAAAEQPTLELQTHTGGSAPVPPSLRRRDLRGFTLLHYAVEGGNQSIIAQLLAASMVEALPDAPFGAEPVSSACDASDAAVTAGWPQGWLGVRLPSSSLLDDAPPNAVEPAVQQQPDEASSSGVTSEDTGSSSDRRSVAPLSALHLAAKLCQPEVVRQLLTAGYSASARTAIAAQTPLHCAAMGTASLAPLPGAVGAAAPSSSLTAASASNADTVYARQMEVVEALLEAGADPRVFDAFGCSALSYAAGCGNSALVTRLLAAGCDPLHADKRGLSPLHWGAAGGSPEVVTFLLAAGRTVGSDGAPATPVLPRLTTVDSYGRMPLHWAAERGAAGCVAVLTAAIPPQPPPPAPPPPTAGPSSPTTAAAAVAVSPPPPALPELLHAPDSRGCSAVELAAAGGHVEVVARLLGAGRGRGVGAEGPGPSALHLAAQHGLEQVVAQLCALPGCDVNARDADGLTPLHAAATRGSVAIADSLLAAGADPNIASATEGLLPLHSAAAGGHMGVVEALLEAGSLVSYKSGGGATPLHAAAGGGHTAVCEALLEAGCPVMGRLASGASALYCAASGGWSDVCALLLRSGAEVDATTSTGCTALHGAASNGHAKVISLLLGEGADPDVQSSNGHTPLHNAVSSGHAAAIEALLAGGADVDVQNTNGNTPLHIASSKGFLDIVSRLLAAGAELHIRNGKGWCAVHSAASNGYFDAVLRLVQAGASWKRQGETDVVKMVTRKTTLKTSYVEGRLRLAERERHRNNQGTAAGMGGEAAGTVDTTAGPAVARITPSGKPVPATASFEDLAAAADANMAALLKEEEAAAAAAAAAAERKAALQKKKKAGKASTKAPPAAAEEATTTDEAAVAAVDATASGNDGAVGPGAGTAPSEEAAKRSPTRSGVRSSHSEPRASASARQDHASEPSAARQPEQATHGSRSASAGPASKGAKRASGDGNGRLAAAASVKSLSLDSSDAVASAGLNARSTSTTQPAPTRAGAGSGSAAATGTKAKTRAAPPSAVNDLTPLGPAASAKAQGRKLSPVAAAGGTATAAATKPQRDPQQPTEQRQRARGRDAAAAPSVPELPATGASGPASSERTGSAAGIPAARATSASVAPNITTVAIMAKKAAQGTELEHSAQAAASVTRGRTVARAAAPMAAVPMAAGAQQPQTPQQMPPPAWGTGGALHCPSASAPAVTLAQVVAGATRIVGRPATGAVQTATQPPPHAARSPTRDGVAPAEMEHVWPPLSAIDKATAAKAPAAVQSSLAATLVGAQQSAKSQVLERYSGGQPIGSSGSQPQPEPASKPPQPRPSSQAPAPGREAPQGLPASAPSDVQALAPSGRSVTSSPIADALRQHSPSGSPHAAASGTAPEGNSSFAPSPAYGDPCGSRSLDGPLPGSPGAAVCLPAEAGAARVAAASSSPFGTATAVTGARAEAHAGNAHVPLQGHPAASLPVSPLRAHEALPALSPGLPAQLPVDWSFATLGSRGATGAAALHQGIPPHSPSAPPLFPLSGSQTPLIGSPLPTFFAASGPPQLSNYLPGGLGLRSGSGPVMPSGGIGRFAGGGATWGAVRAINAGDRDDSDLEGSGGMPGLSSSAPPNQRLTQQPVGAASSAAAAAARPYDAGSGGMHHLHWSHVWGGGFGGSGAMDAIGGFFRSSSLASLQIGAAAAFESAADAPTSRPARVSSASPLQRDAALAPSGAAAIALAGGPSIWAFQPSDAACGMSASAFSPLPKLGSNAASGSAGSAVGKGAQAESGTAVGAAEQSSAARLAERVGPAAGSVPRSSEPRVASPAPGANSSYAQFRCPLTRRVMSDPVVASDGCTYERSAIEAWMRAAPAGGAVSPVTGELLVSKEVVPNFTMRAAIQLLARQ